MTLNGNLWDPETYMAFAELRTRPGLELMARITHPDPEIVVDLGCGPGHLTAVAARRWPAARVFGIDSSAEMLGRAEAQFPARQWPTITWQHEEIATWAPASPVSVLYSNAALHWVENHEALFPRLLAMIESGGVFAVQMPDNWDEPSHRLIAAVVEDPRWRARTSPVFRRNPVAGPAEYRNWLRPLASEIDQWRTTYYHILEGSDPVLGWVKGSILRPILSTLEADDSEMFLARLAEGYRLHYSPEADGRTVFPFSRQFLVARRGSLAA
jgi:trans-aconitate 2-methyltransferase